MKNYLKILSIIFIQLLLISCSSWSQKQNEYRYTDDGEAQNLPISLANENHKEILEFPIYAAFSKSIYFDGDPQERLKSLDEFCSTGNKSSIFRPIEWEQAKSLAILKNREIIHSTQLKLKIEVFKKKISPQETTALIVFRGTDFDEEEDLRSDFRWFNRFFSTKLDQYDEVRILTPMLVEEIIKQDTSVNKIITTGHSLGGGLAQLAGYSSHLISTVYAFDPSPVTGFYDIEEGLRRFNSQNLKIFRIYENGEILAYLRLVMKGLYPVSDVNPDIVQVRFDFVKGEDSINQHGIKELACNMHKSFVALNKP